MASPTPALRGSRMALTKQPTAVKAKHQPGYYQLVCQHHLQARGTGKMKFDLKVFSSQAPHLLPFWDPKEEAKEPANVEMFWNMVDAQKCATTN